VASIVITKAGHVTGQLVAVCRVH